MADKRIRRRGALWRITGIGDWPSQWKIKRRSDAHNPQVIIILAAVARKKRRGERDNGGNVKRRMAMTWRQRRK